MRHLHTLARKLSLPSRSTWAGALAASLMAACGGGSELDAGGAAGVAGAGGGAAAAAATCDTRLFVAGLVETPTSAQLGAYAGTYNGDEGKYGPNPGDPFVKSGTAAMVLSAGGTLTYKGTSYTVTSICIEKTAGALGKLMYVHTDKGHFDIADKADATLGIAWGISPVDGATIYTKGQKV